MGPWRNTFANNQTRRQGRTIFVRIIGATAALCLWSACAHAQINPFRGYKGPHLSKADLEQGIQAADKLLKADDAKVGASETWTGPTSGNSGTLTVQSAFERKGLTCRALRSDVNYKAGTKRTWILNVCRVANGDWKLAAADPSVSPTRAAQRNNEPLFARQHPAGPRLS